MSQLGHNWFPWAHWKKEGWVSGKAWFWWFIRFWRPYYHPFWNPVRRFFWLYFQKPWRIHVRGWVQGMPPWWSGEPEKPTWPKRFACLFGGCDWYSRYKPDDPFYTEQNPMNAKEGLDNYAKYPVNWPVGFCVRCGKDAPEPPPDILG